MSAGQEKLQLDPLEKERWARAGLSRIVEPTDTEVAAIVACEGAVAAFERVVAGHGAFGKFRARVLGLDTAADFRNAAMIGARVVIPGDDEWPIRLDDLAIPPWCLWVRGPLNLQADLNRSVSIVGSRASSPYGEQVAAEFAASLASRGWVVVSGAAFGIDGAAHRGALAAGAPTVAVLAGGVDRAYPAAHTGLLQQIVTDGAIVSEMAPGAAPMKMRFLRRNRIIAALTRGVLIVEADIRSGSLSTAGHAEALARPIAAVPGPITSMTSSGCHLWIRDHDAALVTSPDEVIEHFGDFGVDLAPEQRGAARPEDALDPMEAQVHDALPVRGGIDVDRVCLTAGVSLLSAQAILGRLERRGHARRKDGLWSKARPSIT